MSSYISRFKNPKTGKEQDVWCIDDWFGRHKYGYFFKKNGGDCKFKDFDGFAITPEDKYDIYKWEDIKESKVEDNIKINPLLLHPEFIEEVKWPPKKKYPCKKLKGEHDFELAELHTPSVHHHGCFVEKIFSGALYTYRCSACGKKHFTDKPLRVTRKTKDYLEK